MDKLAALRQQLTNANVSDQEIANGVRLTSTGISKLARKFAVTPPELETMLRELSKQDKADDTHTGLPADPSICESDDRFAFEADFQGNVQLTDSQTGATHYLQASEGAKFLQEIDRVGNDYQSLIAPYFANTLREFVEPATTASDAGDTGGTYNFPYEGNFACARFWLEGNKPMIEVMSVVDANGQAIPLDGRARSDVEKVAWEWVDKV